MAKGNKKAQAGKKETKEVSVLNDAFKEYEEVFDMLIEQANTMGMILLAKSIELAKAILQTYKKAWVFKVENNAK